jgi:Ca2+-binding RTX toxin-like protein
MGTRGDALGDVLTNFEILMGSGLPKESTSIFLSGDDLQGSNNGERIYGMDGADTIHGMGGSDIIYGNHPDSSGSLQPGYDADKIYGGAGNDLLYGQTDDDERDGEDGVNMLDGGLGNDHLITMDLLSADFLEGGEGFNRLAADYSDKTTPLVHRGNQQCVHFLRQRHLHEHANARHLARHQHERCHSSR